VRCKWHLHTSGLLRSLVW